MKSTQPAPLKVRERPSPPSEFIRIGYWSALACGLGAVAYGVASILVAVLATSAITWPTYEQFIASYSPLPTLVVLTPPFLVTLIFPVLAVSIHAMVSEARQPFALLGLVFAGVYTAVLGAGYWMQLTFIPQSLQEGNTAGLALWVLWHPRSFFWSIESFGYFSMGIAGMFLGLACKATPLSPRARSGLMAMFPLGIVFMINEALGNYPLGGPVSITLVFAWVILFAFVAFSLARMFAGLRR